MFRRLHLEVDEVYPDFGDLADLPDGAEIFVAIGFAPFGAPFRTVERWRFVSRRDADDNVRWAQQPLRPLPPVTPEIKRPERWLYPRSPRP